jgi:hypothetical protein
MDQLLCSDWLPERARSCTLGIARCFPKEVCYLIYPLLAKLGQSRWLDIGFVLFCVSMDLDYVSVHKLATKIHN